MSFILNTFTINANVPTSHKAPETTLAKKNVIISIINALNVFVLLSNTNSLFVILDTVVKQNRENYELQLSRFTDIENLKK